MSAQNFLLDGGLRKPLEREQQGWQGADRTYMYLYRLSGILASWNDTTTAQIEPHIKYRNYKEKGTHCRRRDSSSMWLSIIRKEGRRLFKTPAVCKACLTTRRFRYFSILRLLDFSNWHFYHPQVALLSCKMILSSRPV